MTSTNIRKILSGKITYAVMMVLSVIAAYFQIAKRSCGVSLVTTAIALLFISIVCLYLIFFEELTVTTLPFILLCVFLCTLYSMSEKESENTFEFLIKFWWLAIPILASLIYHFIRFRKPFVIGPTFYSSVAVAIAVTLGGLGYIPASDYFRPVSLYYSFGLGIGMLICYLLIKPQLVNMDSKQLSEKLITVLYMMGILSCFCILFQYVQNWDKFIETKRVLPAIIARNEFALFIMFALPAPFYLALKNPFHLLSSVVFYTFIALSGSRGGLIFGAVEYIVCLIYMIIFSKKKKRIIYSVALVALVIIGLALSKYIMNFYASRFNYNLETDTRIKFLKALKGNFLSNPVFGQGLGISPDKNIYDPRVGGLYWYHLMVAQIIGSLGILGVICYLFQIINRFWVAIRRISPYTWTLAISYLGIFMMSQVQPGEFCPIPHELLVIILFIAIENESTKNVKNYILSIK